MDITPDRDTRPSAKANRGGSLRLDGQNRTNAHCIKQVRYPSDTDTDQRGKLNWPQPNHIAFREFDKNQKSENS
jgi:hypothetical protein